MSTEKLKSPLLVDVAPSDGRDERSLSMAEEFAHSKSAYWIMQLLGLGLLLPWNVCLNTLDYLDSTSPHFDFGFRLPLAYVYPQLPLIAVMVKWGGRVSYTKRIVSTFAIQGLMMALLPAVAHASPWLVMAIVLIIGICTAILQSSLFGFASQFPPIFNQALMTGQGIAGITASVLRIITKGSLDKHQTASAIVFYSLAFAVMISCCVGYMYLLRMSFAQHYLALALEPSTPVRTPGGTERPSSPPDEPLLASTMSLRKFDPEATDTPAEEEEERPAVSIWKVLKSTGLMCFIEFAVFFMTFSVFPGEVAGVKYHGTYRMHFLSRHGWWGIVLFFLFNIFDTIGRSGPGWCTLFSRKTLIIPAMLRFLIVPLWVLLYHAGNGAFHNDLVTVAVMILFSVSNGYVSSLGMVYGPQTVEPHEKESAGFLLSFFLQLGILAGSQVALLVKMLN